MKDMLYSLWVMLLILLYKDMCFAKLKDGFERCKIGKVAYIPAERNAVTLPNIASLKMPEYNTRSFILTGWKFIKSSKRKCCRFAETEIEVLL